MDTSGGPSKALRLFRRRVAIPLLAVFRRMSSSRAGLALAAALAAGTAWAQGGVSGLAPEGEAWGRSEQGRREAVAAFGGSEGSEAAVELGLDWLARHQSRDGRWSGSGYGAMCQGPSCQAERNTYDVALTGLALLAFQGAGYHHVSGKHSEAARAGMGWMVARQKGDGSFHEQTYEHAIATFALADAYALTGDRALRGPLERAVNYSVAGQDLAKGGWRYTFRSDSDTSVTGWQTLALATARRAGVETPAACLARLRRFLDSVTAPSGQAGYTNPGDPTSRTTAIAIICRLMMGAPVDDPVIKKGVPFVLEHAPKDPSRPDYYHAYYGSLAMFQVGGAAWREWNAPVREALIRGQEREGCRRGSWPPTSQYARQAGRIYSTALATMALEVYYRNAPVASSGQWEGRPVKGAVAPGREPEREGLAEAVAKLSSAVERERQEGVERVVALATAGAARDLEPHVDALIKGLGSKDDYVASRLAVALGRMKERKALGALIDLAARGAPAPRDAAFEALRLISGQELGPAPDADEARTREALER